MELFRIHSAVGSAYMLADGVEVVAGSLQLWARRGVGRRQTFFVLAAGSWCAWQRCGVVGFDGDKPISVSDSAVDQLLPLPPKQQP
jgi:hypothetical protein